MRRKIYLSLMLFAFVQVSCSNADNDDPHPIVEIELEYSNISLQKGKSQAINIISGNGGYTAISSNEEVVIAQIKNNVVTLTPTSKEDRAEAVVIIQDSMYQRANIDVTVSKNFDLVVDKKEIDLELGIKTNDKSEVYISEGNLPYKIDVVQIENVVNIDSTILKNKNRFTVKALAIGEAQVKVTDALGKTCSINVTVGPPQKIPLDCYSLLFTSFQESKQIQILDREQKFKPIVGNPMLVYAQIEDDRLIVTSYKNGKTTIIIEDEKGHKSETIDIEVDAPLTAMNLGTSFFCHADFSSIAAVDMSIESCEEVTFEISCKMKGYRGLQTFMGLEDNLIIRGKNDDYREVHPIEIVGLGDELKLESTSSFNLNEWMHLALVVNCKAASIKNKYKLFINGTEDRLIIRRNNRTHSKVNLVSSSDGNRFEIGRTSGQDWRAMQGIVAEARVWTTARKENQIKENMITLNETDCQGLLADWLFSSSNSTNYIQDANGGLYSTNLTISSITGDYSPIEAPKLTFLELGCLQ